ncbi:hypothetical protein Gorai_011130 [Gossypium raimondii]|uniref:Uncharacterized protein n=1 Tax=Gossypium raimondii TaxID=29730 RepID=A0A7J8PYD0_GOSRA|nr:hypothetical protein [Gossypium raimondii]
MLTLLHYVRPLHASALTRTLRLCQLSRLLGLPTLPEALARASPCVRSHELSCQAKKEGGSGSARRITDQDKDLKLAACLSQHEAAELVVLANMEYSKQSSSNTDKDNETEQNI